MTSPGVVTNFSQYSVAQLTQMLDQADPATAQDTAQTWDSTGQLLSEQAQNLQAQLGSLDPSWSGTAAANYKQMMTDLINGISEVASTAYQMRDVTYDALDALNTARAEMPAAVAVPPVAPASPLSLPLELAQRRQAAAAQTSAVSVMQNLANSYVSAQNAIPPSPGGSVPAALAISAAPAATASEGLAAAVGDVVSTTVTPPPSSSLFGDMFSVGLAAAGAIAGIVPGVVLPASLQALGQRGASQQGKQAQQGGISQLGATAAGLAGSGIARGVSAGSPGGPAAANGGVDPSLDAAGAADAAGATQGDQMPMMPMGGGMGAGMGADNGGNRRIPPWLVEHQDVWGASVQAAPGLIS